jgi:hypothetical protein
VADFEATPRWEVLAVPATATVGDVLAHARQVGATMLVRMAPGEHGPPDAVLSVGDLRGHEAGDRLADVDARPPEEAPRIDDEGRIVVRFADCAVGVDLEGTIAIAEMRSGPQTLPGGGLGGRDLYVPGWGGEPPDPGGTPARVLGGGHLVYCRACTPPPSPKPQRVRKRIRQPCPGNDPAGHMLRL